MPQTLASGFRPPSRCARTRSALVVGLILALSLGLPSAAGAKPPSDDSASPVSEGGIGMASGVATLVYTPVKIAYSVGGLLVAGIVYAYSGGDGQTVSRAIYAPLRGDYVVTPGHLTGKRKLQFLGKKAGKGSKKK